MISSKLAESDFGSEKNLKENNLKGNIMEENRSNTGSKGGSSNIWIGLIFIAVEPSPF